MGWLSELDILDNKDWAYAREYELWLKLHGGGGSVTPTPTPTPEEEEEEIDWYKYRGTSQEAVANLYLEYLNKQRDYATECPKSGPSFFAETALREVYDTTTKSSESILHLYNYFRVNTPLPDNFKLSDLPDGVQGVVQDDHLFIRLSEEGLLAFFFPEASTADDLFVSVDDAYTGALTDTAKLNLSNVYGTNKEYFDTLVYALYLLYIYHVGRATLLSSTTTQIAQFYADVLSVVTGTGNWDTLVANNNAAYLSTHGFDDRPTYTFSKLKLGADEVTASGTLSAGNKVYLLNPMYIYTLSFRIGDESLVPYRANLLLLYNFRGSTNTSTSDTNLMPVYCYEPWYNSMVQLPVVHNFITAYAGSDVKHDVRSAFVYGYGGRTRRLVMSNLTGLFVREANESFASNGTINTVGTVLPPIDAYSSEVFDMSSIMTKYTSKSNGTLNNMPELYAWAYEHYNLAEHHVATPEEVAVVGASNTGDHLTILKCLPFKVVPDDRTLDYNSNAARLYYTPVRAVLCTRYTSYTALQDNARQLMTSYAPTIVQDYTALFDDFRKVLVAYANQEIACYFLSAGLTTKFYLDRKGRDATSSFSAYRPTAAQLYITPDIYIYLLLHDSYHSDTDKVCQVTSNRVRDYIGTGAGDPNIQANEVARWNPYYITWDEPEESEEPEPTT